MGDGKQDSDAPTVDLGPASGKSRAATAPPAAKSAFDRDVARFEVRGELGRGGMGRVDDAFDRVLGRPVAIKHMLSATDVDLARFEREAKITARLEHPGIVPVHETGRSSDGTPYYVMRRIDGRPLQERVSGATFVQRCALLPNLLAACDAVAYAHANGIVHRDIKPTNILVGPFGETLVIDWGLAREIEPDATTSGSSIPISDEQLTRAGTVAGTPGYMAPEQARGESVDARADVYALGATLFYTLAGRGPYDTARATEMVNLAGAGRPPDWNALPDGVPADLRAILGKALASEAVARYRDAGELAGDLRKFVTGNLVGAYDYGALARLARFVRRHRGMFAVAAVSAIALAVVATLSVRRIVAERDDANAARTLAEARQRDATSAADRLLVEHARELASTDPAGAIAVLRTLPAASTRWREAWIAATAAWSHGIPFGFVGEPSMLALQISGDGRQLAVTARNTGHVYVYDLAARTSRLAATVPGTFTLTWIGPHHIACITAGQELAIIDVAHGTSHALGIQAEQLLGDHISRALVRTPDGRVVEIDGPDGEPRTLAEHVSSLDASATLDDIALVRSDGIALWRPSGELAIPGSSVAANWVSVNDHMVVAMGMKDIHAWKIDGDRVELRGVWPRGQFFFARGLRDHLFFAGYEAIENADAPGVAVTRGFGLVLPSPRGFISLGNNGLIELFDGDGVTRLGPNPVTFVRADVSLDGKWAAAITKTYDVMVWNVADFAPKRVVTDAGEHLAALREHALWTSSFDEVVRRDLVTGQEQKVDVVVRPDSAWAVDPEETYVALLARNPEAGDRLAIWDQTLGRIVHIEGKVAAWAPSRPGLVFARDDGSVVRWVAGGGEMKPVVKLADPPVMLADNGGPIIATYDKGAVSRSDNGVTTKATLDGEVVSLVVGRDGTAWFITAPQTLWRWRAGAPPTRVEMAEAPDALWVLDSHPIAHSPRSLTLLDREPFSPVYSDSSGCSAMRDLVIACVSTTNTITLLDLATGLAASLQAKATDREIVAHGDSFAYPTGSRHTSLTTVAVPRDPAALRAWLAGATNAKPVPGSDVVAWP